MIFTNKLGVTIFSILILISFVIPYIFMRESLHISFYILGNCIAHLYSFGTLISTP